MLAILLLSLNLSAQQRDTVYITDTQVIRDTLIVRDTIYQHDTVKIRHQADVKSATTEDNSVKITLPAKADTSVEAVEMPVLDDGSSQKEQKKKWYADLPDPLFFKGFQLGYVLEADILSKAKLSNTQYMKAKNAIGGHIGLEFAYHFAKYLGLSAGFEYGTTGALRFRNRNDGEESWMANESRVSFDNTEYGIYSTGFSMPVKFEFHAPISPKTWVTLSAGVRLRMPWYTFMAGYDDDVSSPNSLSGLIWPDTTEYYDHLRLAPEVLDANRFNVNLLANAGFYFRLGYGGMLRWTVGIDLPFRDFASGNYSVRVDGYNGIDYIMPVSYDNGTFRLRSNMFNTQITFIQTFQKSKRCAEKCEKWKEEGLYRQEFKFDVCDPTGVMLFDRYFVFVYPEGMEPNRSWRSKGFAATPVFSVGYHYRVAKWFWLGLSASYAHYTDSQTHLYESGVTGRCQRYFHTLAIMPEVRFSYLNRPHVTLYSALSVGFTQFFGEEECSDVSYPENRHPWFSDGINGDYTPTQFSTFHVTLLGVKAGWRHVFGCIELGAGYKGLGSVGIGYEF
ncbi:MAG: outer membrane beta-barrel protein [Bacteroidales bacterium]|nr:outer membrane beta-barrel protein [Bacteroidales bacterium]